MVNTKAAKPTNMRGCLAMSLKIAGAFSASKLKEAELLSADYFSNAVLINNGKWNFTIKALPWEAQLTTLRDAVVVNANNDNKPDILLGGNFYACNIQLGKYDADLGTILINKGDGNFSCELLNGLIIKGEVRHIRRIKAGEKEAFILARNNDSLKVISFR